MQIVVIDNYDSFTYNLVQMVEEISGHKIDVVRNDKFELADLAKYDTIICSPGPGVPAEAGKLLEVIKAYAPQKKILGVCLGHQAMVEAFGGTLKNLTRVFHGLAIPAKLETTQEPMFEGISRVFQAGRYHSWVVEQVPDCFEITAKDKEGHIMAISHKEYKMKGVQFHPESVLTPEGYRMIENFINL